MVVEGLRLSLRPLDLPSSPRQGPRKEGVQEVGFEKGGDVRRPDPSLVPDLVPVLRPSPRRPLRPSSPLPPLVPGPDNKVKKTFLLPPFCLLPSGEGDTEAP